MDTLPDDDPSPSPVEQGRASHCRTLSDPGRVTTCLYPLDEGTEDTDTIDDDEFSNFFDDSNPDHSIAIELNAIRIQRPEVIQAYDIMSDDSDDDESILNEVEEGSSKDETPPIVDDDPDAIRAQIDSGAFASCTDQLHMLHDYKEFSKSFPCPLHLLPAAVGLDLTPKGVSFLHVPALNAQGHIAVRTFYHPNLRTTVIDECDFQKFGGTTEDDYTGTAIHTYNDAGTFSFRAAHHLRRSQDVIVHGVVRHGKLYTGPLIPPDLPIDHPLATPKTSHAAAIASDPDFARACERATIQAVYAHQEREYAHLRDEMTVLPQEHHKMPFHEYIQQNTPIQTIQAETE